MSSAEDVQNTNGILTLPRFQKCMGRVPSDEKIPDDMSAEDKCTVQGLHRPTTSLIPLPTKTSHTNFFLTQALPSPRRPWLGERVDNTPPEVEGAIQPIVLGRRPVLQ